MTRTVVLCRPGDRLHEVWSVMKERRLKNIPIVDQDVRPLGVLNARDALEALLEEVEYEESSAARLCDVRRLPLISRLAFSERSSRSAEMD